MWKCSLFLLIDFGGCSLMWTYYLFLSHCQLLPPTLYANSFKSQIMSKSLWKKKIPLSHLQTKLPLSTHVVDIEFTFIFPNNMNMLLPFDPSITYWLSTRKNGSLLAYVTPPFSNILIFQFLYTLNSVFSLLWLNFINHWSK